MRKSISPKLRFFVLQRDEFKCVYCGNDAQSTILEIDHKVPVSKGGTNAEENLVTSCIKCNAGKSDAFLILENEAKALKYLNDHDIGMGPLARVETIEEVIDFEKLKLEQDIKFLSEKLNTINESLNILGGSK